MITDFSSLKIKMAVIEDRLAECPDLIKQEVRLKGGQKGYFLYFEGLVDQFRMQREFVAQILPLELQDLGNEEALLGLPLGKVHFCRDEDALVTALLAGEAVFIADRLKYGIAREIEAPAALASPPAAEGKSLYGSNTRFGNHLPVNLAMIRRRIKSARLKFKIMELGSGIPRKVVVAYLDGEAAAALFDQLAPKIQSRTGAANDPEARIEHALSAFPNSPFPQYQRSHRPDQAVTALLQGRLVIFREETPLVLITPVNFFAFFQAPDDLEAHWLLAAGMRLVRMAALVAIVLLPALYIAVSSFHYQFLGLNFLITLAESRARIHLAPVAEVLFMELILAIMDELTRLPAPTGLLVGIAGSVFLAGALLTTGTVSAILLMISALSWIASFLASRYHIETIRLLRLIFIVFAAVLGMLGVAIGASLTFAHLIVLHSLGRPYLRPFIPFRWHEALELVLKVPRQYLRRK